MRHGYFLCKFFLIVSVLATSLSFTSCRTIREVEIQHDTIALTEIKEVVVHDTTKVTEVKHDSIDHYIEKITYVDSNGVVHEKEIERLTKIIFEENVYYESKIAMYKDSIADLKRQISEKQNVEYIAKPLTWWQKTQMYGFWALLAVVVIYIFIRTRKGLMSFLKTIYT